jgi:hypothetical protein
MKHRRLYLQACREWKQTPAIRREYHTCDHYWREKYARVYQIDPHFAEHLHLHNSLLNLFGPCAVALKHLRDKCRREHFKD